MAGAAVAEIAETVADDEAVLESTAAEAIKDIAEKTMEENTKG